MPDGYRDRAIQIISEEFLSVKVLHPLDFIHAKSRRFTEEDIDDALFVVKKFDVKPEEIKKYREAQLKNLQKILFYLPSKEI